MPKCYNYIARSKINERKPKQKPGSTARIKPSLIHPPLWQAQQTTIKKYKAQISKLCLSLLKITKHAEYFKAFCAEVVATLLYKSYLLVCHRVVCCVLGNVLFCRLSSSCNYFKIFFFSML